MPNEFAGRGGIGATGAVVRGARDVDETVTAVAGIRALADRLFEERRGAGSMTRIITALNGPATQRVIEIVGSAPALERGSRRSSTRRYCQLQRRYG